MLNGGNLSILSLQIWTPEKPKRFHRIWRLKCPGSHVIPGQYENCWKPCGDYGLWMLCDVFELLKYVPPTLNQAGSWEDFLSKTTATPNSEIGGLVAKKISGLSATSWLVGGCCWISADAKKLDEWIIEESFTMARITSNINAQLTDSHEFTIRTIRVPRYWIDIESYSRSFSKPRLNNPVLNQLTSQFLGL